MSNLLTDAEVQHLTGYAKPAHQAQWCRDNGVVFYRSRDGRVIIPAAALVSPERQPDEPDFSHLTHVA